MMEVRSQDNVVRRNETIWIQNRHCVDLKSKSTCVESKFCFDAASISNPDSQQGKCFYLGAIPRTVGFLGTVGTVRTVRTACSRAYRHVATQTRVSPQSGTWHPTCHNEV